MKTTEEILKLAKRAKASIGGAGEEKINSALLRIADALVEGTEPILEANRYDIEAAKGSVSEVMTDRLRLNEARIQAMAEGIREIAALPYPVGKILSTETRPNGLVINKVSVPIGVIAIIYESRPNVTSDAAALALKSGNVCILRGGKEAYRTSRAIVDIMRAALDRSGICPDTVQLIDDTTRESANALMKARGYVDLLIPRGGAGLIRACVENATVPCLETGTGICHVYADKDADLSMAVRIIENAKCSRPSVCNAMEVLLVHKDIAAELLPKIYNSLVTDREAKGATPVRLIADSAAREYIKAEAAGDGDYDTEFLDYTMAIRVVGSAREAIEHISLHSTHHSEAIITSCVETAAEFTAQVDSAAVYVNASTRFTDGGEFGLGCEMGISTQKMHARGPLGIRELTTYKYIISGNGQIR